MLSAQAVARLLDRMPVARLATLDSNGRACQVPIVFARAGDRLWSPVDGKPKSGRELARIANLRASSHASLLVDEYDDDWSRLWWIALDVEGEVVRPDVPEDDPAFNAAADALRQKYPQYERVTLLREPPTLLAFRVVRIRSWSAS